MSELRTQIEAAFGRYETIMDDWEAFVQALMRPLPSVAWTNTLRTDAQELERWLRTLELDYEPISWCPGAFRIKAEDEPALGATFPYLIGLCHLQEEVSVLPGLLLEAQPGERILDMCAAPGGKTAYIAVGMQNQGTVVANDKSFGRLRALRAIVDRMGLLNVTMTSWDASSLHRDMGLFDRVLADVPCSCEGTSRKNGKVLESAGTQNLEAMAKLQKAILKRAIGLTRPGGRIVYSTCTYAPEENELVIQSVLDDLGEHSARLVPIELPQLTCVSGLTSWQGQALRPELAHTVRVYPHHQDSGGFYVAVLERMEAPL